MHARSPKETRFFLQYRLAFEARKAGQTTRYRAMQMAQRRGGAAIDIIYRYSVQKAAALESELAASCTKGEG
jgi:hypothetical protein